MAGDANTQRYVGNGVTVRRDASGLDWLDDYADWFWGIDDFFGDVYGSGEMLSDPSSVLGQLICGDIYDNQIWGDPGVYVNVESGPFYIPTPSGTVPIHIGGGFEIVYDWGNDGNPGTGWNFFVYPQIGIDNSPSSSVGIGLQQVYNFTPMDYQGSFINGTISSSFGRYGGPSLGYSATPGRIHDWGIGVPKSEPYTYYGGWNWSNGSPVSADVYYQYYIWLDNPNGIQPVAPF